MIPEVAPPTYLSYVTTIYTNTKLSSDIIFSFSIMIIAFCLFDKINQRHYGLRDRRQSSMSLSGFSYYTLWGPPSPSKSDKTLYTGIYLPTFREDTNFIIKLLVLCLGALYGPKGEPPLVFIMVLQKSALFIVPQADLL